MVWYGARLLSRNFLGLVTFYIQLITNILKQLISDLSVFLHLLLNLSLIQHQIVDSKSIVVVFRHICDQDHGFLIHTNEVFILNHFL